MRVSLSRRLRFKLSPPWTKKLHFSWRNFNLFALFYAVLIGVATSLLSIADHPFSASSIAIPVVISAILFVAIQTVYTDSVAHRMHEETIRLSIIITSTAGMFIASDVTLYATVMLLAILVSFILEMFISADAWLLCLALVSTFSFHWIVSAALFCIIGLLLAITGIVKIFKNSKKGTPIAVYVMLPCLFVALFYIGL